MAGSKQRNDNTDLKNLSVNSSRVAVCRRTEPAIRLTKMESTTQTRAQRCRTSRYPSNSHVGLRMQKGNRPKRGLSILKFLSIS